MTATGDPRALGAQADWPARREFLRTSGQVGLGVLALALGGAGRPGQSRAQPGAGGAREIHLEAREVP